MIYRSLILAISFIFLTGCPPSPESLGSTGIKSGPLRGKVVEIRRYNSISSGQSIVCAVELNDVAGRIVEYSFEGARAAAFNQAAPQIGSEVEITTGRDWNVDFVFLSSSERAKVKPEK